MNLALSTWCRRSDEAPADFAARALALGAPAIAIDARLDEAWLAGLRDELRRRGDRLPVLAVEAPCPRAKNRRTPSLATRDREERRSAIEATRATIQLAGEVGAGLIVVRLGELVTDEDWGEVTRSFARRELRRGRTSDLSLARGQNAGQALDLARLGLDPVLDAAAQAGVTVAIVNRARWFEIPDDVEILALLDDFHGAPLTAWLDPAATYARFLLGFDGAAGLVVKRAAGAWFSDAAGLRGGFPWTFGEVDTAAVARLLPDGAMRVVHASPIATDLELLVAIAAAGVAVASPEMGPMPA